MNALTTLLLILVAVAALLFIVGIIFAGYFSWKNAPQNMPAFLINVTTIIGGVLATNFGAVIGLSLTPGTGLNAADIQPWYAPTTEHLQVAGAYLYAIGLLLALVLWGLNKF